jgi:large subunit ribosomal protein L6
MSRIGKKPVEIPKGVEVKIDKNIITAKGPKGTLSLEIHPRIKVTLEVGGESNSYGKIVLKRPTDEKQDKALHGTMRALVANMIEGVSKGYEKVLEIFGVGYRAQVQGNKLIFSLGYSHPVEFQLPEGIKATVDSKQTTITLQGADKALLGQVAANIRALRPPDPYKGKGIRYAGEQLRLKPGKAGKK